MSAATVSFRAPVLPWAVSPEDEARFRRILRNVLGISVMLCLLFMLWPRPVQERGPVQALPPRVAKMMLERELARPVPPPPPAPQAARTPAPPREAATPERAAPTTSPRDRKPEPDKPATVRNPVVEARNPQPGKAPGEVGEARRRAAGVGLLAMKDELAELRGAPLAVQIPQDVKPGKGVGSGEGVGVGAGSEPGIPTRSLITSNATGGSGGINTAAYSRHTGGGGLAGRATTLVEGVAGGGGGGGPGTGGIRGDGMGTGTGSGKGSAGGTVQRSGSGKASRSIEEIKLVFERHKGAIYAIYNRALREDPTLQGKVVMQLTIAPSGAVVNCRIVSSELNAPDLESKLLARVRQFDFGAKDVEQMVVTWPVDFLPS
ncbi:TonB family protein [Caldimonas thermodepolymerans]|uniref:Energy transducer TonB n=1 Tax=Caldimonas thermodepolymerans TaxID=215580 RepID=A0A2S5T090_9BURK|nr:AgmX/PglI C-terminal domain-containing protein [Caldimonas thermodepolymerans]PPE68431.1 energy transducer TonB [Caldimonas thermodepolymerans]QPC30188.1 TonB family protein [Caldimonas thermodepolymerans]RDI00571.1 outer membrane transport energization protein TonB [Caldimonas thermodepolymerans]TCP07150.1 outer membrane transport energization protein TonB [Caldimonas thermodepolymerans]UZG46608.1 TonB family protein [Caldimonas thermodepolymerans]